MLLGNLKLLSDDDLHDVQIERGRIQSILPAGKSPVLFSDSLRIRFEKALVFPGLINSHDHLDFNLFPRLGNRLYMNYREWGLEINKENKNLIGAILRIPQE